MHTRSYMLRLQMALAQVGDIVFLNTQQFYSEDTKRTITKYIVTNKIKAVNKQGEEYYKSNELFSSCSQIKIVQFLADRYDSYKERGVTNAKDS